MQQGGVVEVADHSCARSNVALASLLSVPSAFPPTLRVTSLISQIIVTTTVTTHHSFSLPHTLLPWPILPRRAQPRRSRLPRKRRDCAESDAQLRLLQVGQTAYKRSVLCKAALTETLRRTSQVRLCRCYTLFARPVN
jgi:hypothetical protein